MTASPQESRWTLVAGWFDELADLSSAQREARLAQIAREDAAAAADVRALLEADASEVGLLDEGIAAAVSGLPMGTNASAPDDGRAGPYRLLHAIGEGGMGAVFLAERSDGSYEQHVAVKLIKRGMDSVAIVRRFLRERRILARLAHRNIVRLLDGGISTDGRPFYVMEHVDGVSITEFAAQRHLDVAGRVRLVAAVAEAVAYAHTQLVVHRDLKPSNVLVDAAGEPHVLDFGIAKLIEESGEQTLTGTNARVLSPAYAAPEQVLGHAITTATDVYALALMLCELLVGHLPQPRRATTPAQLALEVTHETTDRASALASRLSPARVAELYGARLEVRDLGRLIAGDLDVIIATGLQRDAARRYPTAAAFADDLRRWIDRRPIDARADSTTYRIATFVRRHRFGVAAAAAVVLSLIVGLGAALWQMRQAHRQADLAQQHAARAERVKSFLVDVFRQSDPLIAQGATLSAAEILRRGRVGLATSLSGDSDMRGELLMTIAEIQSNLGERTDGLATAEEAFPLLVGRLPDDDPRVAYAYSVRGALYDYLDRTDESVQDLRHAQAILGQDPVSNADRLDRVDTNLAFVLNNSRTSDAAVALQEKVVERVRVRLGEESTALADSRISLALLLEDAGDYVRAGTEYRHALPVLLAGVGPLAPRVCEAERNYAGLLDRLGNGAEAEPRFLRALRCTEQLYGTMSVPYARTLFSRAILLLNARRYDAAEADFRQVLSIYSDTTDDVAHAHRYLGRALDEQDRHAEAASEFAIAERLYRKIDQPNDVQRWRARADYGYALFRDGNVAGGRSAIDAALAGMHELMPKDDRFEIMRPLRALGEVARTQGEFEVAAAAHRKWRALALTLYGARSREAYQASYQLALDLARIGGAAALAEAQTLAKDAIDPARADAAPELAAIERFHSQIAAALIGPTANVPVGSD
ncbi:MAG: protein kinase [Dokdonella sp.]|uniref:protein kinase domain-containing protein n=1 Tax=Dokdonella sp. TaxID=2291710 RepID=UPI003266B718